MAEEGPRSKPGEGVCVCSKPGEGVCVCVCVCVAWQRKGPALNLERVDVCLRVWVCGYV